MAWYAIPINTSTPPFVQIILEGNAANLLCYTEIEIEIQRSLGFKDENISDIQVMDLVIQWFK